MHLPSFLGNLTFCASFFASEPLNYLYYQPKRNDMLSYSASKGYVVQPSLPLYWHSNCNTSTQKWNEISWSETQMT